MYNIVIECVGSFFNKSLLKFVKHAKNFLKNDSERVRPKVCHFRVYMYFEKVYYRPIHQYMMM